MNNIYALKKLKDAIGKELFEELSRIRCLLAGGAVVSIYNKTEINDWDIYVPNKATAFQLLNWLESNSYACMSKTRKSFVMCKTDCINVNVIIFKYFDSLKDVFNTFDFTCCMGGFNFGRKEFDFHPDFFKDNLLKRLVYSKLSHYPIGALLRVQKYLDKGFSITRMEMVKIALHCTQLKLETLEELEDQINGMYGIDLKEIYDEEEFSVSDFLEKLQDIEVELDREPKVVTGWDEDEMWDDIFQYTKILGQGYRIINGSIFDSGEVPNDYVWTSPFPLRLYKWVRRDPKTGELSSFFKQGFKYEVDKIIIGQDSSHGIHCGTYTNKKSLTYSTNRDAVLIELLVEREEDIISFWPSRGIGTKVKKALVTKIVTETPCNSIDGLFS